jgi:hypothetical protein
MPNQEEQHKTWRMLKRAVKEYEFNTSFLPVFTAADKVTDYVCKHTDERGTWTITSSVTGDFYLAFNGTEAGTTWWPGTFSTMQTLLVEFPKGVLIAPSKLYLRYCDLENTSFIEGHIPGTDEWVKICNFKGGYTCPTEYLTLAEDKQLYYDKIRVNYISYKHYSYYQRCRLHEVGIIAGKCRM